MSLSWTVSKMRGKNNLFTKVVSILIIQSFILSNIAFALPDNPQIPKPANSPTRQPANQQEVITDPEKIVMPREFGLVKSKFIGSDGRLIIHIQDAHCNYEAQTNIIKILEGLVKNYNLKLISVEGADGDIDTSWFKAFPDDEIRKEVATYFMKKGEITGPEFLSITTDYPIKLFGAETRAYYIQNLNAFTSSYPLKEETERYYTQIKNVLARLKNYIYTEDLKAMDTKLAEYEAKKIQFNDYIRFLQYEAEKQKIGLREYENFFKLVSTLVYEKKIDFAVTDKERGALIDELSKKISKETLTELVSQSISFKAGKISSVEYYRYLRELASKNGFDLSKDYPNLYNYIIYNSVYSRIENEQLFSDIKKVETAIKERLFKNDDQRTLDRLSRHADIVLGLINIKLLNGDFEYYEANKKDFSHDLFADFIKRKTQQYGFAYVVEPPSEAVAESIPKLEDFYSIAIKRDKALVDNTLNAMKKDRERIAVLVTGGFHSEGIVKLLEKQGISHMVVCPSITKDVPTPYIQVLTNQRTPLEDILVNTPIDTKQGGGMLAPYMISAARQIKSRGARELNELIASVPAPAGRSLADRVSDFETDWSTTYFNRWIRRAELFAGRKSLPRDKDILLQAFKMAVDSAVVKNRISRENRDLVYRLAAAAFDEIYKARGAEFAQRANGATDTSKRPSATPGRNAVRYEAEEGVSDEEHSHYRAILKESFDEDTYDIVPVPELGEFRFVIHYAFEERITKYNREHGTDIPTDVVHPGRGPLHDLRQAHISAYRYRNLNQDELMVIARHELAHIDIANENEASEAYRRYKIARDVAAAENKKFSEEDFVDSLPGCDTRIHVSTVDGRAITVRAKLRRIDRDRQRNAFQAMAATLVLDTTYGAAAREELLRMKRERAADSDIEKFVRRTYERRHNIDLMRSLLTTDFYLGYDVIIVSNSTEEETKLRQEELDRMFDGVETENKLTDGRVIALSVLDTSEGGQVIGQAETWLRISQKAREKYGIPDLDRLIKNDRDGKIKAAVYHNGGKGERFSPASQALNLSRAAQKLGGKFKNRRGEDLDLTLMAAVILETAPLAMTSGNRIDTFWTNQVAFGTVRFTALERTGYPIDKMTIGIDRQSSDLLKNLCDFGTAILNRAGKILHFLANKKLTKRSGDRYVVVGEYQGKVDALTNADRAVFDFGSFSMNKDMHYAMIRYWSEYKTFRVAVGEDGGIVFDEEGRVILNPATGASAYKTVFEIMKEHPDKTTGGIARDIDSALVQIIVPLMRGLAVPENQEILALVREPSYFRGLSDRIERDVELKKAALRIFKALPEDVKIEMAIAAMPSGTREADAGAAANNPDVFLSEYPAVKETIEFLILFRDNAGIFGNMAEGTFAKEVVGSVDFGMNSHWFAYKRLLDAANEKFIMLSDLIEKTMQIALNGSLEERGPYDIEAKIMAEDARRMRGITAESVARFKFMDKEMVLSAAESREGVFITTTGKMLKRRGPAKQGVWIKGSVIQGDTELLPGSSIVNSVVNDSKGRIECENCYVESSSILDLKGPARQPVRNSIIYKVVDSGTVIAETKAPRDGRMAPVTSVIITDIFRPQIDTRRLPKGQCRFVAEIGYDPTKGKVENDRTKRDTSGRYSLEELREDLPGNSKDNNDREALIRAEVDRVLREKIAGVVQDRVSPTMTARYRESKRRFARSTFGEQLVFGTSGIRELVKFLEDVKCYSIAKAIASYFKRMNEPDTIALAADLRPSSPRITQDMIMGNLALDREVVYAGNVPTPAVVNYGMYREDGAVPSAMVTASHCPVLPEAKHQNGIKPNRTTGEVLKEDERLILKHVREFLELEFMTQESQNMFDAEGRLKSENDLSETQRRLVGKALELMAEPNDEARRMYVSRYVDTFGEIFDQGDEIDFIEHMAVGRKIIAEIFTEMGAKFNARMEHTEWQLDFIVDTEDLQPKLLEAVNEIAAENKKENKPTKGIFTTDGDSDRPALFHEDGTFVYGDKLGYLTCEYIRNLKAYEGRETKFFAAVTATVSNTVIERLESIGFETVEVVKVGSPYIVKAIEDRKAKGGNVICMGFERNGGFLLGSDITLDNGKVLRALPTRDAVLPIIAAFSLAKHRPIEKDSSRKDGTIGQLVNDRFSGTYASYGWSKLIEAQMTNENIWLEFIKGRSTAAELQEHSGISVERWPQFIKELIEKGQEELPRLIAETGITDEDKQGFVTERIEEVFRIKAIFDEYTTVMGQAIMRSFSPRDLKIVEVTFNDDGIIEYQKRDGSGRTTIPSEISDWEDLDNYMRKVKADLERHFSAVNAFTGGIVRIQYLDGVRIFFKNRLEIDGEPKYVIEVVHMRPSGNAPQLRIYSEASTQGRAEEIAGYRFTVYSNIIEEYLLNKRQYEGVRIEPRSNAEMKKTFDGIFSQDKNNWTTWKMVFGPTDEHSVEEDIVFRGDNLGVTFYRTTIYNIAKDRRLAWLPRSGYKASKLAVNRSIAWDRQKGTLTCKEGWSDGRRVSVVFEGPNAWLEIGKGIDKNIPMGKFQDMPFPVMSDEARDYFKDKNGIFWLDLFDLSVESEFTVEAPMWEHNFNFKLSEAAAAGRGEKNIACGNMTRTEHDLVEDGLKAQLEKFYDRMGREGRILGEEEADRLLLKYAQTVGTSTTQAALDSFRRIMRGTGVPASTPIFFAIPEDNGPLFRVRDTVSAAHYAENANRIQVSLPFLLHEGMGSAEHLANIIGLHEAKHINNPNFDTSPGHNDIAVRLVLTLDAATRVSRDEDAASVNPNYMKSLAALDMIIKEGKPLPIKACFKLGVDGYTWGEPIEESSILGRMNIPKEERVNFIVENLTEQQRAGYAARYAEKTGQSTAGEAFDRWLRETGVREDVIGERWFGAGVIDVGTGYNLPIEVLSFWPEEVFGASNITESGVTAKHLTSARPLSVQYHRFPEMIIPLEGGSAYIGSSRPVSGEGFVEALQEGDESILAGIPVAKDQPIVVPAGMPHAYGRVRVYEVKGVTPAEDAKGTISFYDRLRLSDTERKMAAEILQKVGKGEITEEEAARLLVKEKLARPNKDLATMVDKAGKVDKKRIEDIAAELDRYGYSRKTDVEEVRQRPVLASSEFEGKATGREIMGSTESFVSLKYTVEAGEVVPCDAKTVGTFHTLFAAQGKVHIHDQRTGELKYELAEGEEKTIYAKELGAYDIRAVDKGAIVYTQYRPSAEKSVSDQIEWTAENILNYQTTPDRDSLRSYIAKYVISRTAADRTIIVAYDTALGAREVAQAGERPIKEYLNGRLINVRATGKELIDSVREAISQVESGRYVVVTIASDGTVAEFKDELTGLGKVLNIANPDNKMHIPIIGLYELALRIGYDSSPEDILRCLNRIAVNPDNGQPFVSVDDLFKLSIIRLLPKIVPVDHDAAQRAYKAAQDLLKSV